MVFWTHLIDDVYVVIVLVVLWWLEAFFVGTSASIILIIKTQAKRIHFHLLLLLLLQLKLLFFLFFLFMLLNLFQMILEKQWFPLYSVLFLLLLILLFNMLVLLYLYLLDYFVTEAPRFILSIHQSLASRSILMIVDVDGAFLLRLLTRQHQLLLLLYVSKMTLQLCKLLGRQCLSL